MRLPTCYLFLVTFFGAYTCFPQDSQPIVQKLPGETSAKRSKSGPSLIEGRVVKVVDGDTVTIQTRDKARHSIRLQAVDAPDEKQENAKKSRRHLEGLIEDQDVKVVVHKNDQSGNIIGTVYLQGRDVGLAQIEAGMAWHFKQFGYEQTAASRRTYAESEAKAKADRLGLWEDDKPVPPWEFRRDKGIDKADEARPAAAAPAPTTDTSAERKYILGPRGGCYYVTPSGRKVYVDDKSLCAAQNSAQKP